MVQRHILRGLLFVFVLSPCCSCWGLETEETPRQYCEKETNITGQGVLGMEPLCCFPKYAATFLTKLKFCWFDARAASIGNHVLDVWIQPTLFHMTIWFPKNGKTLPSCFRFIWSLMRPYEPMKRWVVNTLTIRYYSPAQPKESKITTGPRHLNWQHFQKVLVIFQCFIFKCVLNPDCNANKTESPNVTYHFFYDVTQRGVKSWYWWK